MISKFTIPADAKYKYPVPKFKNENLGIDSWFSAVGKNRGSIKAEPREDAVLHCRKVPVVPDRRQAAILNRWFEIYRVVYNFAVKHVRIHGLPTGQEKLRDAVKPLFPAHLKDEIQ